VAEVLAATRFQLVLHYHYTVLHPVEQHHTHINGTLEMEKQQKVKAQQLNTSLQEHTQLPLQ
jgi:hypothetical protein